MDIKKRLLSFKYAFKGIYTFFATQTNARIHLLAASLVSLAGFYFSINKTEWLALILTFAVVLAAEALNTAIEFVVDLVSPQYHPLAEKAKDVAAGAVLMTAFAAILIGCIIFVPKIWA